MSAADVAQQFNAAINKRDLEALAALMTDDHTFVDSEGNADEGKEPCVESWRGFFAGFPDYRNVFASVVAQADLVVITGHSTCSFAPLDGPAIWTALVRDDKVAEWRVYDDTPPTRQRLGIA